MARVESMPSNRVLRWSVWSLTVGPAAGWSLAIIFICITEPQRLLQLPKLLPALLLYWGAAAAICALVISPVVVLTYAAWALACYALPVLDRWIIVCAPALSAPVAFYLGWWLENDDALDVGREFSQAGALGLSLWLTCTLALGILLPRYFVHGLRPGSFERAT